MTPKRILFISKGEHSASTRYRALTYFPYLKDAGWQPQHLAAASTPLKRLSLLKAASQADVVVVLRRNFSTIFLFLLRRFSHRLVFDFDDAIFLRSNGEPSKLRMKRFQHMMHVCDQVWAGNTYLADMARRLNNNVDTLPTSIKPEKYSITTNQPSENIDLVWIGSSSTRKYLVDLLPTLELLSEKNSHCRLKIIADFDLETTSIKTLPIQWGADTEAKELASSHIGIAPMTDNPWTQGKCALKILQYMASGLPVVASPAGINKDVVINNETGYLATTTEEWLEALQVLISDAALRVKLGKSGRENVIKNYSEASTANKMLENLNQLCQ